MTEKTHKVVKLWVLKLIDYKETDRILNYFY